MSVGIGANVAILGLVHAALIKPLPFAQPDQIYSVEIVVPERREQIPSLPASVQTYFRWRSEPSPFAALAAVRPWEASLSGDGDPERVGGARISANFFSLLGVAMAHGRDFAPGEEQPGRERVVVISDALWRRRYGGDAAVIGRTILINGENHVVIGVAPPTLLTPASTQLHPLLMFAPRIDMWKPIAPTAAELAGESWDHGVLARLPDAGALESGRWRLQIVLNELIRAQEPDAKSTVEVRLVPIREVFAGSARPRLLLMLAAAALMLLTACASIANVFLARVVGRTGEFATRVALGASRARILGHTLCETLLLALLAGAAGGLVGAWGARLLALWGPDDVRALGGAGPYPLLLFAAGVSLITGLACGIVPAWRACRHDPGTALHEAARAGIGGGRSGRLREALVSVEMALATLLLACAGLLLHSFVNVMAGDRGYEVERVLAMDLSLSGERYASAAGRAAFYRELIDGIRVLPGVAAAGAISYLPAVSPTDGPSRTVFHPADADFQRLVLERPVAMVRSITAGYFAAGGTAIRAGRALTDNEPAPVAVISESLSNRLWPGETAGAAIGRRVRQGDVTGPLLEVVGVAADAHPGGLDRDPAPAIYRPYAQWASGPMTLVIRTAQDPARLASAARGAVWRLDGALPIAAIRTMRQIVAATVAPRRFQMLLVAVFAVMALLLGAVGAYGVVNCAVTSRTREIGLRMALGAVRADVMRWVIAGGMRPVVVGMAVGLAGAAAAAGALRSMLFGIAPVDPISFAIVVAVLLGSSGLACYVPARRAAALDPMTALRHE
jgi:predicted permease